MALIGNTNVRGNIKPAGIAEWWIRAAADDNTTDTNYVSLGSLADGKLVFTPVMTKDSKGREKAFGFKMEATAKMLSTDKVAVIKMLDTLSRYNLDHYIICNDGSHYSSNLLTTKYFGFNWKLVSDADFDKNRYIEVKADRFIQSSELSTLVGTDAAYPSGGGGGTLLSAFAPTRGGISAAGFSKFEFREKSHTSTWDDLGQIRNGKFIAETVSIVDTLGRSKPHSIKISVECQCLQGSGTEVGFGGTINADELDHNITFMDGTIFTTDNVLGSSWEYHSEADFTDSSFQVMKGEGFIINTISSTWDSLWT